MLSRSLRGEETRSTLRSKRERMDWIEKVKSFAGYGTDYSQTTGLTPKAARQKWLSSRVNSSFRSPDINARSNVPNSPFSDAYMYNASSSVNQLKI